MLNLILLDILINNLSIFLFLNINYLFLRQLNMNCENVELNFMIILNSI